MASDGAQYARKGAELAIASGERTGVGESAQAAAASSAPSPGADAALARAAK